MTHTGSCSMTRRTQTVIALRSLQDLRAPIQYQALSYDSSRHCRPTVSDPISWEQTLTSTLDGVLCPMRTAPDGFLSDHLDKTLSNGDVKVHLSSDSPEKRIGASRVTETCSPVYLTITRVWPTVTANKYHIEGCPSVVPNSLEKILISHS